MIFFNTLTFCFYLALSIGLYHLLRIYLPWVNAALFLVPFNLWFAHKFFKIPTDLLLYYSVFIALYYFCVTRLKIKKRLKFFFLGGLVTIIWLSPRFSDLLFPKNVPTNIPLHEFENHILALIGISYTFCRLISFLVDYQTGLIPNPSLFTFFAYLTYFPAWLSGPVTKYQNFSALRSNQSAKQLADLLASSPADRQAVNKSGYLNSYLVPGFKRITSGVIKKNILAQALSAVALPFIDIHNASRPKVLMAAYLYWFYIYFDFSGYTDLAVGTSKLFKLNIPENFNNPIAARNPQDFFARWHISLVKWLYEYIFGPLYTFFLGLTFGKHKLFLSAAAVFLTFVFAGIWHGEDIRFFREGLFEASALFVFILFDGYMKRRHPILRKQMKTSVVVTAVSTVLTFHFAVISFMLFSLDSNSLKMVAQKIIGI